MGLGKLLLGLYFAAVSCSANELVFAITTGGDMPITDLRHGVLVGGLQKEFSDALAKELHFRARYLIAPRKRVEGALAGGQADVLCGLRPEWLDRKDWLWSKPIFSIDMVIVSRADTAPVTSLAMLADQRLGTILGYRYPELEAALGSRLHRDDAATDDLNLAKLLQNRFAYMATVSLFLDYQRKIHPRRAQLNAGTFKVMTFDTLCALPAHGKLSVAQLDEAVGAMRKRGQLQQILDQFRPGKPR